MFRLFRILGPFDGTTGVIGVKDKEGESQNDDRIGSGDLDPYSLPETRIWVTGT